LANRGVDLISALSDSLQARVSNQGIAATSDDRLTVILLHIPVSRAFGEEPGRISHRAFILLDGALALGAATGALFKLEDKYYRAEGVLGDQPSAEWRDSLVFPMGVLRMNDASEARRQSGISNAGPAAVLVGAGSLGSAMLNLWSRSGWGKWTVIDNDYIKPHNLSRHVAYAQHVGDPKTNVVVELNGASMAGATSIQSINADATDFEEEAVKNALTTQISL